MNSINKLLHDPFGVGLYYLFEKWRTKDGRRVLSTNLYKKLAKQLNSRKYKTISEQRKAFLETFQKENDFPIPDDFMKDGWTVFDSEYFPYTKEVVEESLKLFEEKGPDTSRVDMPYSVVYADELLANEAFYNFAFSKKMIAHAAKYLGEYPILNNIDLLRSDPTDRDGWLNSQQLHLDVIDTKILRVVVYITDVDEENGPFTFFPLSVSNEIKKDKELNYGSAMSNMSVEDAKLTKYENAEKVIVKGKSGSVLTVDSCNCFHYGSRAKSTSRCALMLSFTSMSLENLRDRMNLDISETKKLDDPLYIKLVRSRDAAIQ